MKLKIKNIQEKLKQYDIEGWLFYDFHQINHLALTVLEISKDAFISRRFFYWVPQKGEPIKLTHKIEPHVLDQLPGKALTYNNLEHLKEQLKKALEGIKEVAMEYSPKGEIPQLSLVDAGTFEMIKELRVNIVSSANLLQYFTSLITDKQYQTHKQASQILDAVFDQAWSLITKSLKGKKYISEYVVQQYMENLLKKKNCQYEGKPIVAIAKNSADPHYSPSETKSHSIVKNKVIYLDCWCKINKPKSIYADKTQVAITSDKPTQKQQKVFDLLKEARDAGFNFLKEKFERGKEVRGFEVDKVVRQVIIKGGYGNYFTHRTGHNIGEELHGYGTHLDSFETHDNRLLLPRSCFSIEPGIYIPGEFGMRIEYDVYINDDYQLKIDGKIQKELLCLMK